LTLLGSYIIAKDVYNITRVLLYESCGLLPPFREIVGAISSTAMVFPFFYTFFKRNFSKDMREKYKNLYNFFVDIKDRHRRRDLWYAYGREEKEITLLI